MYYRWCYFDKWCGRDYDGLMDDQDCLKTWGTESYKVAVVQITRCSIPGCLGNTTTVDEWWPMSLFPGKVSKYCFQHANCWKPVYRGERLIAAIIEMDNEQVSW